ncbi:copper chaperone [Neobacillus sp. PS3-34]|uniref:heavy-metal-associated domain-containing protein n=1 Tax=Neobacillus sp. PS3-34 TaxID=3070678 RepID=UPI0027E01BD1|nr:copper chaperone [Neobacillus sp. PS3-34]WML48050.1 copper chaperone [Neobacillus sp. PS3-34]
MENGVLKVRNIQNQQDADKILEALNHVWGIDKVEINQTKGEASFAYDERMASTEDFVQAVKDSGFEVTDKMEVTKP